VAVYSEYGGDAAVFLREAYGTPFLIPCAGPPIGFDATESFVREVCAALNSDPRPALEEIEKARARAYLYLARFSSLLGLPKGALYSIKADGSTAYALARWLSTYLGMIPSSISLPAGADEAFAQKLRSFLAGIGYEHALDSPIVTSPAHVVFADGSTIAQMRLTGRRFGGIELSLPSLGYLDIVPKTFFGGAGGLFLLEQILNGLRFLE
jgi:nitrogenase molybdenum-iron protein alpha/beta subunit